MMSIVSYFVYYLILQQAKNLSYLSNRSFPKRLTAQTPYLIKDTTKTPNITKSGILLILEGL